MTPQALPQEKKALRKALREERDALAQTAEAKTLEKALNAHLTTFLASAQALLPAEADSFEVACFLPLGSEFDLNHAATPQWLYPRVASPHSLVWFRRGHSLARLSEGAFGVKEAPKEECFECTASALKPWVVVVPALACDSAHMRLGYGGGFYDRFLARHGAHVLSVCCLPQRFVVPQLPTGDFDKPIDVLIDERKVTLRPRAQTHASEVRP